MTEEEIKFFDALAPNWDAEEVLSTPRRIQEILQKLQIKKGDQILDLGTGTGVLIPYMSLLVGETGHIIAIDASEGMLSLAIKKYGDIRNVSFINIDFESNEIEGNYDLIMLYSVYPHLHHPEKTLKQLSCHLKKNGSIIIAFPTDESFINNIHKEKKADSDLLPSAHNLCKEFCGWGLNASVVSATKDEYIVKISN